LNYGLNDFVLATGYKKNVIKSYFKSFKKLGEAFETKIKTNKKKCKITILDTGLKTMTGGRLKKAGKLIRDNEDFMFTYGDGISNINLNKLFKFHKKKKKLITVTAVRPPARFG
jgi:glucose-1-phosphate cytidylyltransferase